MTDLIDSQDESWASLLLGYSRAGEELPEGRRSPDTTVLFSPGSWSSRSGSLGRWWLRGR